MSRTKVEKQEVAVNGWEKGLQKFCKSFNQTGNFAQKIWKIFDQTGIFVQKFCKRFDQTGNILVGPGGTKSGFPTDSKFM